MNHRGEYKVPGGKLVVAEFSVVDGRLANVRITGDFFLFPEDAIHLLSQSLEGATVTATIGELVELIDSQLSSEVEMLGIDSTAVAEAVRRGLL